MLKFEFFGHKQFLKSNFYKNQQPPAFESYQLDVEKLKKGLAPYEKYKKYILIGNGGSRNTALGYYLTLKDFSNHKPFKFISGQDPDIIQEALNDFSNEDTLVVVISKSGTNIDSLEPLMAFADYDVLAVTGKDNSKLRQLAEKMNWFIFDHPQVGGRFAGLTEAAMVPAFLMGLPINEIISGAQKAIEKFNFQAEAADNQALQTAKMFFDLEQNGYRDVFSAWYSDRLFGFYSIVVQLVHETFAKNYQGLTFLGDAGPEVQHHTSQRFFGGPKNMIGCFLKVGRHQAADLKIKVPPVLKAVEVKSFQLNKLNSKKFQQQLHFDLEGVKQNAQEQKIPFIELTLEQISPESIGYFLVFWLYFAVYSAYFRNVDPFNQPAVERAKEIALELRDKNYD